MQRVIRYFQNDLAMFRDYYQNGQEQIDNTNFYALRRTSLITTLLLAMALVLMFSTDQHWELSAPCAVVLMIHLFLCVALHARAQWIREKPGMLCLRSKSPDDIVTFFLVPVKRGTGWTKLYWN